MIRDLINNSGRNFFSFMKAPAIAKIAILHDIRGLHGADPGPLKSIDEALMWLERAQDSSISKDGGVASHFSLITGWSSSYPETTGYIIPTILNFARKNNNSDFMERAERMLDWLVSIQYPEGCFQSGTINSKPAKPCTFNTGQILIGLSDGVRFFGNKFREPMRKAANWLVETQDDDGCWRNFPTPFAALGEKTYETHVSWGLLEAAKVDNNEKFFNSAMANIRWAVKNQNENGWLNNCCLTDPLRPLTHTLGYALRGILEGYLHSKDEDLFSACRKLADGLILPLRSDGFLPGRISSNWSSAVSWACLTGSVQIAYCWFILYQLTGEKKYYDAAISANRYVRRTQKINGPIEIRGGISGSFPVYGDYQKLQVLNWATKFFIDSNLMELAINEQKTISKN